MATTKATVRRLRTPTFVSTTEHRINNKNILNRRLRNAPFKLKKMLPEQRKIEVKKTGQVVRTMKVRRKTIYFTGKRKLQF